MKILIADDTGAARLLLGATLRKLGHEVVATENGQQAWEAFLREPFAVVIADWRMPEVDGAELCKLIRSGPLPYYPYLILLTMLTGKGYYLEGMAAGADDFISKPFDEEQLAARLRVAERIISLHAYAAQIESLLPLCPRCRKVDDGEGGWVHLELYLAQCEGLARAEPCPACRAHLQANSAAPSPQAVAPGAPARGADTCA
ncbi:MAG TPA: response regulator [Gemmataceae bacterium]|nr:response regulator [Gemmataceae bacterium]